MKEEERNRTCQITLNKSSSLTSREKEGPEPSLQTSCCCCCRGLHRISVLSFSLHVHLLMDYRFWAVDAYEVMNSAEQTITWLITLGVLESPKKTLSDPEGFLQASLRDGVVLCKLLERLRPGSVHTVSRLAWSSCSSITEYITYTKAQTFLCAGASVSARAFCVRSLHALRLTST